MPAADVPWLKIEPGSPDGLGDSSSFHVGRLAIGSRMLELSGADGEHLSRHVKHRPDDMHGRSRPMNRLARELEKARG